MLFIYGIIDGSLADPDCPIRIRPRLPMRKKITFTYSDVINKDYDITNYSISSSSKSYLISIEGKLADYLITNNKNNQNYLQ